MWQVIVLVGVVLALWFYAMRTGHKIADADRKELEGKKAAAKARAESAYAETKGTIVAGKDKALTSIRRMYKRDKSIALKRLLMRKTRLKDFDAEEAESS